MVRFHLVQHIWRDGEVEPADVEFFWLLCGGLLEVESGTTLVIAFQEEIRIGAEAWVNFALLEAKILGSKRYYIVDCVVGVDDQSMGRLLCSRVGFLVLRTRLLLRLRFQRRSAVFSPNELRTVCFGMSL